MNTARRRLEAVALKDGSVLVVGGRDANGRLRSAERYDPTANSWSSAGSVRDVRDAFTLTLLKDGRALVVGGSDGNNPLSHCDLYDPTSNSWSPAANLSRARFDHVAALLPDGRVLVGGGEDGATTRTVYSSAEIYDPAQDSWTTVSSMSKTRRRAGAKALMDGRVLVAGGRDASVTLGSAELYDLGSGGPPVWAPSLVAPAPSFAGAILALSGTGLTGRTEAGSGTTAQGVVNLPLIRLTDTAGNRSYVDLHAFSDTQVMVHLLPSLALGSYQLEVIVAGSISQPVPLTLEPPPPGPQQMQILSAPQTVPVNSCSGAVIVELQDAAGLPLANLVSATAISPSAIPSSLSFFSDSNCLSPSATLSIPSGQTVGTFYFVGASAGAVNILLASPGLSTAVQSENIVAGAVGSLAFVTAPVVMPASTCTGPVTLEYRDQTGVPASLPSNSLITLQSGLAQLSFFSDSGCMTPLGPGLILPANSAQASSYLLSAAPGLGTIQASMVGAQGASQEVTVTAGSANALRVSSTALQVPVGSCAGPVRVAIVDSVGNPATLSSPLLLDLSASPTTTLTFFGSSSSCAAASSTLTIPAGQSSGDVYFSDTTAGAATLRATDNAGALGSATQTETLLAGAAMDLAFEVQPTNVAVASLITPAVKVVARDQYGNRAASQSPVIQVALGNNPNSANLAGTLSLSASAGQVTYSDLSLDKAGTGLTLSASSAGLQSVESQPFDVSGSAGASVDPSSPVSASAGSEEACAGQGVYLKFTVEALALDGTALPPGRTVTLVADPPYLVAGTTRELPGTPTRYEIEIGSNRCGATARIPIIEVDGVALTSVPSITFTCPAVQSTGFSFSASPKEVPADGQTPSRVSVTVTDRCGNPAFGRLLTLDATDPALNVSVDPSAGTTSDAPGLPTDGSAVFNLVSTNAGVTGVAAHMDGITGVSPGDLVTFSLGEVLRLELSSDKQQVVAGELVELSLVLSSSYAGRLEDLLVTLELSGLEIVNVVGADELPDGSLSLPLINPRGRVELGLRALVKTGFTSATAQATANFGNSAGLRRDASSNKVSLSVVPAVGTGCECGVGGSRPESAGLSLLFLGLFAFNQLRRRKRF